MYKALTLSDTWFSLQKVLRMVEIAAMTCEKLAPLDPYADQDGIAAMGTEYIALAKDVKIALRDHVNKLVDVPATVQSVNAMKEHRELETWALKSDMILKQLVVLSQTFQIPLSSPRTPAEAATESSST